MAVCATLASTSFIVAAAITDGLDPGVLTLMRFLLAALILSPYVKLRYGIRANRSLIFRCGLISVFPVIFFWCMFLSLRHTSALNTSVIFTLVPSFSGIYAVFLVRERLGRSQLLALLCGMVGTIWVIFRGDMGLFLDMNWNRGDLVFLGGCCAMGLYAPLVKLLHRGEPLPVMTFWILLTGGAWLFLLSGYRLPWIDWRQIPLHVWCGILYLSLFSTIATFFLGQFAISRIGPTRMMAYAYLHPGIVLIIETALGRDMPTLQTLPGICIVLLAMFVIQRSKK